MRTTLLLLGGLLLGACAAGPDPGPKTKPSAAAVTAAPPSVEPPGLRLPGDMAPARYELDLTLDPAQPTFQGTITVHLEARRPARVVWLHAMDLTIRGASLGAAKGAAAQDETGRAPVQVIEGKAPFVGFVLPEELSPGTGGALRIDYEGKIDGERPQGVYAVSEGSGPDDRYLYTLFEPLDARRAFPCFDEPEYKVPWKVSIRVKKGHGAHSNAEIVGEKDEGGWRRVDFAETPPLPSYLVAFMAGPFDVVEAGTAGREKKRLRFIVPRGRGAETRYAAAVTPRIVGALEDYFGMAYPYSKLDVAVVPRYEGTMEHAGIVALGQPLTLIQPGEEALSRKQAYVTIASHELAHFWFGDLVTLKWWDDTWLNESFAQWMDAKITDAVEPSWGVLRSERLARAAEAMHADGRATAKRMRQPITSVEDILHAFDGNLTYQKGASIITMMEHAVGPEKWRAAMRRYMERFADKTVSAGDLVGVLAETLGSEAAAAFESFLNQPGVPQVTAERDCGPWPPRIKLSQKRYLPLGSTAPRAVWNMPVCVRYGAAGKQGRLCTFLAEESKSVPLPDLKECPEWIVPNEEGAGYHVSGYREEQIDRLTGGGKGKPQLAVAERAAMVRDVGLLVASGEIPLGKALGLIPDAVAAGDKATLVAAQSIFRNIQSSELPEPLFRKLQAFARKTFSGRAKALGFSPAPDEAPGTVEMREMLLYAAGLGGEDPEILAKAKELAREWLEDPKSLSPDVAAVTLALAARSNDPGMFDKIVATAKGTARRTDKELLLTALSHVTDTTLAERALGLVLSTDFDLRESLAIAHGLLAGRRTRDLAYAWLKRNFDEILRRSSTFERPFYFILPGVYCDAAHRADVEAFFGPRARTVEGAQPRLAGTLEAISLCEASHKAALPGLEAFLKRY